MAASPSSPILTSPARSEYSSASAMKIKGVAMRTLARIKLPMKLQSISQPSSFPNARCKNALNSGSRTIASPATENTITNA